MKFIDKVLSDCYCQTYVIIDANEKEELLDLCKEEVLVTINYDFVKDTIFKYNTKKNEISENSEKLINKYFINEISTKLEEYITDKNLIFASDVNHSIIGNLNDNNPITIIFSYCYFKKSFNMKLPKVKIYENPMPKHFIYQVINEILIALKEYDLKESSIVDDLSEVLVDYLNENTLEEQKDYLVDVRNFAREHHLSNDELDGLGVGTYYLINDSLENYTITIKKIYEKQLHVLDDRIVKKMDLFDLDSKQVFIYRLNKFFCRQKMINSALDVILSAFAKVNDYNIDKYVLQHYQIAYDENKTIKEQLTSEQYRLLCNKFTSAWIYGIHHVDDDIIDYEIMMEYQMKKLISPQESKEDFEEFYNSCYSLLVIYDFCVTRGLIERKR